MGTDRRRPDGRARRLEQGPRPSPRPHGPALAALTNAQLAELLAAASAAETDRQRQSALRRASLAARGWDDEAADLVAAGRPLTRLWRVGPWIAGRILDLLERPPEIPPPPALRSGYMTRSEALGILRRHPEWRPAVRADLQMHTTETDGAASIEEMATAAAALGHERVAITDHSKTLRVTRGMDETRLLAQGRAIDELNDRSAREGARMRVLKGIEMDLTPEGAGDMDAAALATLDVVLGAFHSQLRLTEDQTPRYLAAIERSEFDILAHPRTRMWNRRAGLVADWRRVAERAAEVGVALEIDGSIDRNDLDVATLRTIVDVKDLWFAADTDAHHPDELAFIDVALATAAEAGVPRERVVNLLEPAELEGWLRERPRRRRAP